MNAITKIDRSKEGVQASTVRPITSRAARSAGDVGDRENLRQAKWELDRCADDQSFAAWARKWGEAFVSARLYPGV